MVVKEERCLIILMMCKDVIMIFCCLKFVGIWGYLLVFMLVMILDFICWVIISNVCMILLFLIYNGFILFEIL